MLINNFEIIGISNNFDFYGILNGKKCFVENAVLGDILNIEIQKETKDYYWAKIIDFVKKSSHRIEARCKYFLKCGGCCFQNIDDDFYYNIKLNILKNYLKQNFVEYNDDITFIKVGVGKRRRVSLKYQKGKFGFYKQKTNEFIDIDKCINVEFIINKVIERLTMVRFINLNSTDILAVDNQIGINLFFNKMPNFQQLKQIKILLKDFRVGYIFYTIIGENAFIPVVNDGIYLKLKEFKIKLPNCCFLQATKESQDNMIDIIVQNSQKSKNILDLYCGIGTYSFPLSKIANVTAVEGDEIMIKNLKENITINSASIVAIQRDILNNPFTVDYMNNFDLVVINPPRNGSENQCKIISNSNVKKIIYISCSLITLVRDLKYFKNSYKIRNIFAIDQFYWSKHLECLVILEKI